MSTTSLTRIAEIVQQIEPLGRKSTGMPIDADDWNRLVAAILAILSIDRQQEESSRALLDEQFARKEHEHLGAVSIQWLDADLRERVGEGQSAVRTRLDGIEKKLSELAARVDRIEKTHDRLQGDIDHFAVIDVDRTKVVRGFEKRFNEVTDVTRRVNDLVTDFTGVKTTVAEVAEFRNSLVDAAGQRIDVAKIRNEVEDLKLLRENLKGADGKPVRLLDLELKVRELADIAGAGEGLDQRFDRLGTAVEGKVLDNVRVQITDVRRGISEEQDERVKTLVRTSVADAEVRLGAASEARIKASHTEVATQLSVALLEQVRRDQEPRNKAVDEKLAEIDPRITRAVTGTRAEIETAVRNSVLPRITTEVNAGIAAVETRVNARVTTTERAFETFAAGVPDKIGATVKNETLDLRDAVSDQIKGEVAAVRDAIRTQVPIDVQEATTRALSGLDTRIGTAVGAQVGDLGARVKREVDGATRDLPARVETAVHEGFTALQVDTKIAAATAQSASALRVELQQITAAERARTTTDLSALTLSLRGEISAAVAVGKRAAIDETKVLIDGQRVEIDRRFATVRPVVVRPVNP